MSLARRLALTLLVVSASAAWGASPAALDVVIRNIRTMQAPRLVGDTLVLSYRSRDLVRFVGARFRHELGAVLHVYAANEHGVFVLDYPLPENADRTVLRLGYRIVADGVWMTDPSNPLMEVDDRGIAWSVYEVEGEVERSIVNPEVKSGRATFVFKGAPGSRVSLVGDFNAWDPFAELMHEIKPGEFAATIEVRPGRHYYAFYADGRKVLDEKNSEIGIDPDGRRVNAFTIPYTRSD